MEYNYKFRINNYITIEIKEDIARDYITIYTSKKSFDPKLNLLSCYPKRHREKTRLSPLFTEIFLEEAKKYGLKKEIDKKARKIDLKIISDYKAEDIDALAGARIVGDKAIKVGGLDLQKLFDFFVRNNLTPFYPEDRSVGRVKKSIIVPFYSNGKWKSETAFIDFFDKSDKVDWWFKNGDRDATFFAVPYDNRGEQERQKMFWRYSCQYRTELSRTLGLF